MKFIKGILYLLVATILILLVVALFAPTLFISKYHDRIITEVQEVIGRKVQVGDISARIIPAPQLTLKDVRIPSVPNSSFENFVEAGRINVNLELMPLLSKTVEITSLDLEKARIFAEKFADGTNNWTFPAKETVPQAAETNVAQTSSDSSNVNIILQKGNLYDSQVTYLDHAANTQYQASQINFTLHMASLQGPFDVAGSLNWDNLPVNIEANVGSLTSEQLSVNAKLQVAKDHMAQIEANVQMNAPSKDFAGKISINSSNAQALAQMFDAGGSVPKLPFSLFTTVRGDKDNLNLDQLAITLQDSIINGNVAVVMQAPRPKITTQLVADKLSIDNILAAMPTKAAANAPAQQKPAAASPKHPQATAVNMSPVDVSLDVLIKQLIYSQQQVNNIVFKANLTDDILSVDSLNIQDFLGGNIAVSGKTDIKTPEAAGLAFNVAHPDVPRLLRAAKQDVDLPSGVRNIALKGNIGLGKSRYELKNLQGTIGTSTLKQGRMLVDISGNVPYVDTNMSWGMLDATSFTSAQPKAPQGNAAATQAKAPAKDIDFSALGLVNAKLSITADTVQYAPHTLSNMHLQASVQNKVLTMDELSFNAYKGGFRSALKVDAQQPAAQIQLNTAVSGMDLGQFAQNYTKIKPPTGKLHLQANLATAGKNTADFGNNLNGNGSLNIGDFTPAGSSEIDNFVGILKNLGSLTQGGASFIDLETKFTATNGLVNFDPVSTKGLVSTAAIGSYDIAKQYLDVRGTLKLLNDGVSQLIMSAVSSSANKEYSFAIYGPVSNLKTELPSDLQTALDTYKGISSGDIKGLLSGDLGQEALQKLGLSGSAMNAISGFLGMGGAGAANTSTAQDQTPTLDDVLKGLSGDSAQQEPVKPKEVVQEKAQEKVQEQTNQVVDQVLGADNPLGGAAKDLLNNEAGKLLNNLFN